MEHSFNIEIAKKLGVDEAILIHNIAFWIKKNQSNNVNYYEGYYRTYNSAQALAELFPYWSKWKIYKILKKLEDKGIIKTAIFNKHKYDRTKRYTITAKWILEIYQIHLEKHPNANITDVQIHLENLPNGFGHTYKPIPDINTYNKTHIKNTDSDFDVNFLNTKFGTDEFEEFRQFYPKKTNKNKARKLFYQIINNGEISAVELIEKAKQYKEQVELEGIEKKYVKAPDKWLEDGNYLDEYEKDENTKLQKIYDLWKSCGWQRGTFYKKYPQFKEYFKQKKEELFKLQEKDPDFYML